MEEKKLNGVGVPANRFQSCKPASLALIPLQTIPSVNVFLAQMAVS